MRPVLLAEYTGDNAEIRLRPADQGLAEIQRFDLPTTRGRFLV